MQRLSSTAWARGLQNKYVFTWRGTRVKRDQKYVSVIFTSYHIHQPRYDVGHEQEIYDINVVEVVIIVVVVVVVDVVVVVVVVVFVMSQSLSSRSNFMRQTGCDVITGNLNYIKTFFVKQMYCI